MNSVEFRADMENSVNSVEFRADMENEVEITGPISTPPKNHGLT